MIIFSRRTNKDILVMLGILFDRFGMLKQDKSSTHLKAMKLQCILCALTTRNLFRYPLDGFKDDIFKLFSVCFLLLLFYRLYVLLLFWSYFASCCHFHDKRHLCSFVSTDSC
jgi:hypothetical protein